MKLLSKYNRVNIPVTIGAILLSSIAFYFILHFVLLNQLDNDLKIEEQEINDYVKRNNSLPGSSTYKDQQISFYPVKKSTPERRFSTEKIFNKNENESFRQLIFPVTVNKTKYAATVRKSQQETEDLIQLIITLALIVISLLLLVLFIVNRFILGELWKPFNTTLQQLKQFNISSKNKLLLNQTTITEFAELNKTATAMTEKVSSDYEALKSFTENASHEIQTPLAIIKMKLELLMQSENMNSLQVECMTALSEATDRLSRLNQSLLLLAKIDNSQFIENEKVNISDILSSYINNIGELADAKNINVVKKIQPGVHLQINKALAETLISNIMSNTIKHNYFNGEIVITLTDAFFSVSNTGKELAVKPHELFERFRKDNTSTDSLGLGLAIVKRICETYSYEISYSYEVSMHTIEVRFDLSKN